MKRPWWIKERHNPQLGIYYVAKGQMSCRDAKRVETKCIYGYDYMRRYDTEAAYRAELARLKEAGESVQE